VSDPEQVVAAIVRAMQPDGQTGQPSLAALAGLLAPHRALLVLDNFEQVVDAAPLVTALLERARGCRVLVTSRAPLRVRGEIEYTVPPLPLPEAENVGDEASIMRSPATALFVRRARDTKPDFAVDAAQAAAIAGVCRLLDGLPLAIELAAARVKVLSPVTMLARLDRPLELLVGGARDLPARQQTLRGTIAWSHDLLSPAEQRLFRRLGVFVGGWTLEAAEAVAAPDGDLGLGVLDGVASLVDKNLVVRRDDEDGGARFALRETVREFAVEQLASSADGVAVRDRHAEYMVALAEHSAPHLEGRELPRWMRRLDREEGNLRAACQWLRDRRDAERTLRLLTALRIYLFIRGRLAEGCDDLLAVAGMPEATGVPGLRVDALIAAAFLAREYGDYDRASAAGAEARDEAERIGDPARKADALINLGYVALQRGDHRAARDLFGESLRLNRAMENAQGVADALSFLGLAAYYEGDLAAARYLDEESLAIWERLNDRQAIVWARTRLGSVLTRQGAFPEATAQFVAALAISRELDFRWGYSWSLDGLAQLAAIRGEREVALELTTAAAAIRTAFGLRLPPTEHEEIARLHVELGLCGSAAADEFVATDCLPQRLEKAFERAHRCFAVRPSPKSDGPA
jgi:predicted ATPase